MDEMIDTMEDNLLSVCTAVSKCKGWSWRKGMKILSGWVLNEEGKREDVMHLSCDDVILTRPFCDRKMQSVRDPAPDLSDDVTVELALEVLREMWSHPGIRLFESSGGWSLLTRSGQEWARTRHEAILMGFESIPWNDKDGGRWKTK